VQSAVQFALQRAAPDRSRLDGPQDWLISIEQSNLTRTRGSTILTSGLLSVRSVLFYRFLFFLFGYLSLGARAGWHLTYGEIAMCLLSSGVGSIAAR